MFDSVLAVPLHFTIEFLGFLIAAGGALLVLLRPSLTGDDPSNRTTVAVGLGILAVAQVAHGAAFLTVDGERVLVAIKALGYAFILFGVAGTARATSSAPAVAGFRVIEPLAFIPAAFAALAAAASVAASGRGGPRALKRLAGGLLVLGIAEAMVAAAPDVEFGGGAIDPWAYASHGAKLAGFLLVGSWLWTSVRSSIRIRFVASFVALLVVVVLALSTTLTAVISSSVEAEEIDRVQAQLTALREQDLQSELVRQVNSGTEAMAASVQQEYASGDDLKLVARQVIETDLFPFDLVVLLDKPPRGKVIASAGRGPSLTRATGDDRVKRLTNADVLAVRGSRVVDEVTRRSPSGASLDRIGVGIAALAASRVQHPDTNRTLGIVIGVKWVDALKLEEAANVSSDRVCLTCPSLIVGDRVVASHLPGLPSVADLFPGDVRRQLANNDLEVVKLLTFKRTSYLSAFAPLRSARGDRLGVVVLSSPSSILADTREGITRSLFLVAMAVGIVVLVLAWISGRRITRPIQSLTDAAQSVREGDLQAQATVTGEDEVGQLGETFNEMTSSLLRMTSDLRDAAREEHRLRARIETIIQSMADALVAVDVDRKVLAFNREAESLTGLKANRALNKTVDRILDARDQQGKKVMLPIFDLSEGSIGGIYLARKDGEMIPVAVTSAVLRNEDDEIAGGVAVIRDMTREREIERMKNEFLANISHELRTPLTPIKGYAEILQRKEVPRDKQVQFVSGILEGTHKLERIVQLLVDFAAMEAGRLSPKATEVDVGSILEKVAEEWTPRSARHRIEMDVPSDLPQVLGDERLLRRSLDEVMDNAFKFSPDGGTIRLVARTVAPGNGKRQRSSVEISISDEGIGIPQDQIGRIFSDFHQLDGSETRTYGGLGLGLAFVERIVDEHNGKVWAQSEPEKGTTVTISIPAAGAKRAAARSN